MKKTKWENAFKYINLRSAKGSLCSLGLRYPEIGSSSGCDGLNPPQGPAYHAPLLGQLVVLPAVLGCPLASSPIISLSYSS